MGLVGRVVDPVVVVVAAAADFVVTLYSIDAHAMQRAFHLRLQLAAPTSEGMDVVVAVAVAAVDQTDSPGIPCQDFLETQIERLLVLRKN